MDPSLKEHDEYVRKFLSDELRGKKSFTIDEGVVAKAQEFVKKRTNLTKVGKQVLQKDSMLFQDQEVAEDEKDTQTTMNETMEQEDGHVKPKKELLFDLPTKEVPVAESPKSCFGMFLLGFILGGLIVAAIFVYNYVLAPQNGWPVLF